MELQNVLYHRRIDLERFKEGEGYGIKLLVNITLTQESNGFAAFVELIDRSTEELSPVTMVDWTNAGFRGREDAIDKIVARAKKWEDRCNV